MADYKDAWNGVAEEFSALGRLFKDRYEAAGGSDQGGELEDALRRLGDAAQRLGDAVGDTVRDPAFRDGAQRAADSLRTALESTFTELSDDIGGLFRRGKPE